MLKRELIIVSDAPEITSAGDEKAGEILLTFYKMLGWNGEDTLNPCKVRTTQAIYDKLYNTMFECCPEPVGIGMLMVNHGPGVDDHIKPGKVHLREGWTMPTEPAADNLSLLDDNTTHTESSICGILAHESKEKY